MAHSAKYIYAVLVMRRLPHRFYFKRFQFTAICLVLGIVLKSLTHLLNFDYFESLHDFFERYEAWELDEAFLVIFILIPGILTDYFISRHQLSVQKRQILVFRSTMYNVNHTVNNLLNQLQYFYDAASEGKSLSPDDVEEFHKLIKEAENDIKILNKLEEIPENLSKGISKIRLE